jgi:hypothetical protein
MESTSTLLPRIPGFAVVIIIVISARHVFDSMLVVREVAIVICTHKSGSSLFGMGSNDLSLEA